MNILENMLSSVPSAAISLAVVLGTVFLIALIALKMILGHIAKDPNRVTKLTLGRSGFQYSDKPFQDCRGAYGAPVAADSDTESTVIGGRVKVDPTSGDHDFSLFAPRLRNASISGLPSIEEPETTPQIPGN